MSRSDRYTEQIFKRDVFSDFLTNFDKNPVTGQLAVVKNEEAVKQSIRNLVLTGLGERLFNPQIGCKAASLLFENIEDSVTINGLQQTIEIAIKTFETRAHLMGVQVRPFLDRNGYVVTIVFSIQTNPQPISIDVVLKRVR